MLPESEILQKINHYIEALPKDRQPRSLYEPIDYVLSLGGKRIRPCLLLMAYNLYKDDDFESVLPVACALETYHNFTLLHDDLMDNASMRRGHQTVHEKWGPNTAILSGDSMLVLAFKHLRGCNKEKLASCLDLFIETTLEIGEGQQYDMDFENLTNVSEKEYIEMIRLKTSVLISCALKMGALLADAPKDDLENLYMFGQMMGLAFQLQDDYLDVYGDPKVFGKAIGGDILCNKKTYMLINALLLAKGDIKEELLGLITAKEFEPNKKIKAVTSIYNKLGIDSLAKQKIGYYFSESLKFLDKVSVSSERKTHLISYANTIMNRKS